LKRTGATLVWGSTTPIPQGKLNPLRRPGDEITYNEIARKVMVENGVVINDLHAAALSQQPGIQQPANVHFTKEGSAVLAKHVAASIKAVLQNRAR
jgi:acyl-CoA thioesterase-1